MHPKTLNFLLFSAAALVTPGLTQDSASASNTADTATGSDVPSLPTNEPTNEPSLPSIPSSLIPVFITAVPQSVISELNDPAKISSLESAVTTQSWYKDLPSGAKSYVDGLRSQYATMTGDLTALTSASITSGSAGSTGTASGSQASETTGSAASGTQSGSSASETNSASGTNSGSGSSATTSGSESGASGSASGSGSGSASGSAASSTSEGVAAPTGQFAANIVGAAGLIGLVAAL